MLLPAFLTLLIVPAHSQVGILTAGWNHNCASEIDIDKVSCWGDNSENQSDPPDDLGGVLQVDARGNHICAVGKDNLASCWGSNTDGESTVPEDLGEVSLVACGRLHSCAIRKADNMAQCWGSNIYNQSDIPTDLGEVKFLSGCRHTCAIQMSGKLWCFGFNDNGQADTPADLGAVTAVVNGAFYTCVILESDSSVKCWGANTAEGELNAPPAGTFSSISAGTSHTCAITLDDSSSAVCWGVNDMGQATVPTDLGKVRSITCGRRHTCAVLLDGTATCWGSNEFNQVSSLPAFVTSPVDTSGTEKQGTSGGATAWSTSRTVLILGVWAISAFVCSVKF